MTAQLHSKLGPAAHPRRRWRRDWRWLAGGGAVLAIVIALCMFTVHTLLRPSVPRSYRVRMTTDVSRRNIFLTEQISAEAAHHRIHLVRTAKEYGTLEALQELTRLAVHRQTGVRARLMLDVGGLRARRRSQLAELGRSIAAEVARTGEPKKLTPMSPFERKIIHDAVAVAGLRSESEGEEPNRRVVVFPAS